MALSRESVYRQCLELGLHLSHSYENLDVFTTLNPNKALGHLDLVYDRLSSGVLLTAQEPLSTSYIEDTSPKAAYLRLINNDLHSFPEGEVELYMARNDSPKIVFVGGGLDRLLDRLLPELMKESPA